MRIKCTNSRQSYKVSKVSTLVLHILTAEKCWDGYKGARCLVPALCELQNGLISDHFAASVGIVMTYFKGSLLHWHTFNMFMLWNWTGAKAWDASKNWSKKFWLNNLWCSRLYDIHNYAGRWFMFAWSNQLYRQADTFKPLFVFYLWRHKLTKIIIIRVVKEVI